MKDDHWADRFAAAMFALAAFVAIVAVVPDWRAYFELNQDLLSVLTVPIVPNLVYAALLLDVGVALRRRLRAAWWVGFLWWLVVPEAARVVTLARGDGSPAHLVGLVLMGVVTLSAWRARPEFTAHAAPRNIAAALTAFLAGGALTIAVGAWLVQAFGTAPDLPTAALKVIDGLSGDVGLVAPQVPVSAPLWVTGLVGLFGAATLLGSAYLLFRAPGSTRALDGADEARVRTMLRQFGDEDSLGYFATRRDKSIIWDRDDPGQAAAGVSYRVVGSVSLASGNPVGDPRRWAAAITAWRIQARANGWSLAVMGAGVSGAKAYADAGLVAFEIGDEAIIDLRSFSLNAPGMKPVRQAVHRLQRRGYATRIRRHASLDTSEFDALAASAARWRGDGGDERGFSMALGRLGDPLDADCLLVETRDADGELRAFLSFVPWGRNGLSLDLMRRDPDADNGLIELMVSALAERAATFGVSRASLNFAMFREAFERGAQVGAGPIARLWRQALLLASRNWQLESLYRSNAKYLPDWQPRFICFEYASDLPRVGTAAGSAEGFLTQPSLLRFRRKGDQPARSDGALDRAGQEYVAFVNAQIPAEPDATPTALPQDGAPEQVRVRREKVERLRSRGIDPYPAGYPRTHTLAEVRAEAGALPSDTWTGTRVGVAGRVLLKRDGGKLSFATLRDGTGDLQVMVSLDAVGADALAHWTRDIDLGDHVGVTGEIITTHSGELTVRAQSLALTSKALRPMPDKRKGLTDPEARVRARHVDLIVRPAARDVARLRSTVVASVRDCLRERGFVEVETPMLQVIHGGANARPFETHINAYDLDLYLRIATELHLKRLIVGGMDKIFEIGRQFRNEGADFTHNPEFTSLELYETYGDYNSMRVLTQQIVQRAATAVYGSPIARRTDAEGTVSEVDLSGDWPVKPVCQAVSEALGEEVGVDTAAQILRRHAARVGLALEPDASWGSAMERLYGGLCEGRTTSPVFYTDFPKDNVPLARAHRRDARLAEKWDLVIFGSEQGTGYSELIDPIDQRERLVAQSLMAAAGDVEAMQIDEDFLAALECGMPPTGGMGLGIDRLVMNLTGLGIRDTILFPLVRPRS